MDKIEAGEYVRTVDGKFGIFDRYSARKDDSLYKSPFNCFIKLQKRKTCLQCSRDYIINHSKNKIKLIEVGDYVNGWKVLSINNPIGIGKLGNKYLVLGNTLICEEEDIKSIVTHEQFESIKYNF